MKNSLLLLAAIAASSTAASAADLPRRAAPPAVFTPVPVFSWTGVYAGLNAGYAWSDDRVRTSAIDPADTFTTDIITRLGGNRSGHGASGFTGGGQIGYNYQFTPGTGLVVGIEADAQYTDLDRRRRSSLTDTATLFVATVSDAFEAESRKSLSYLGTVRGRLGYAWDRFLVYGTGGLAYGEAEYRSVITETFTVTSPFISFATVGATRGGYSRTQTGYAYGGGIEYALPTDSVLNVFQANAVSMKIEYLRYDLGSRTVIGSTNTVPAVGPDLPLTRARVQTEGNLIRAGVNYKFGSF